MGLSSTAAKVDHGIVAELVVGGYSALLRRKDSNIERDLFKYHAMYPISYIKEEIARIKVDKSITDSYAPQNLDWSGQYVQNALTADLLGKVLKELPLNASGPEVFCMTMIVCISNSYEAIKNTKAQLEARKLSDYPGENVSSLNVDTMADYERLESGGAFEPDLLSTIVGIYEGTKDSRFKLWAMA